MEDMLGSGLVKNNKIYNSKTDETDERWGKNRVLIYSALGFLEF
jgi:hypothetical protein